MRIDLGALVALSWLFAALGFTLLFGSSLGTRGLAWMAIHHSLCAIGCAHELRRAWRRRRPLLPRRPD
jgi:hypothetical protein